MPISANLILLINLDFSNRSAIWPAVAENRKNGSIKRIAARLMMLLELLDPAKLL